MKEIEKKLLKHAEDSKLLTADQVLKIQNIRRETGEFIDQVITRLGFATKEQIYVLLEELSGYPTVDLSEIELEKEVLDLIPESVARKNQSIPLFKAKDSLAPCHGGSDEL